MIHLNYEPSILHVLFLTAGITVQGDILINGRKIGPFMNDISGFVYQDDLFIGSLTVTEHLTFMVIFVQKPKRKSVDEVKLF